MLNSNIKVLINQALKREKSYLKFIHMKLYLPAYYVFGAVYV